MKWRWRQATGWGPCNVFPLTQCHGFCQMTWKLPVCKSPVPLIPKGTLLKQMERKPTNPFARKIAIKLKVVGHTVQSLILMQSLLVELHWLSSDLTRLKSKPTCCSAEPARLRKHDDTAPALARFDVLLAITLTRTSALSHYQCSTTGLIKTAITETY